MEYALIREGRFKSRPNRFIAMVDLPGEEAVCHVKNTGRCKELLVPGCPVYLEENRSPKRKTAYDLVCVDKGGRLINLDSQAPNKAVREFLEAGRFPEKVLAIHPEYTIGDSRLDFYLETENGPFYLEVKGVTLEEDGIVLFPDAPTERGVKHVKELTALRRDGISTGVFFVIQMEGVTEFRPNRRTHPQFADALKEAQAAGVQLFAYDCKVTPGTLSIHAPVPVYLD